MLRRNVARTNGGIQRVHIRVVELCCYTTHPLCRKQLVHRQATTLHLSSQRIAAGLKVFFAALLGKPLADLRLRAWRDHKVLPIAGRPSVLVLRGEDLNPVPRLELTFQGHQLAIDLGANAAVAHFRVHGVGEIHRRGSCREVHHIALRRERENLLAGQVIAQGVQELVWIGGFLLPIQKLAHPGHLVNFFLVALMGTLRLLVAPVCRHTEFGVIVHLMRTNLHLKGAARIRHHRGMQRLVHAEARV